MSSAENAVVEIDLDNEMHTLSEIKQENIHSSSAITTSQTSGNEIPIFIKSSVLSNKRLLACEIDDTKLDFSGDSGAIGRLSCCDCDNSSATINNKITVDLIGKQYSGMLQTGPTMMFINLCYQSVDSAAGGSISTTDNTPKLQQIGKVEGVTNEVCKLSFHQDVLGDIFGIYTRDDDAEEDQDQDEDEEGGDEDGMKKRRKLDNDASSKIHKGKKATSFTVNKTKSKSKSKSKSKNKKSK